jgi:hypothetical protein
MNVFKTSLTLSALAAVTALSACGQAGGGIGPAGTTTTSAYQQIELLARPAVKEALEPFADHDATNRSSPYADTTLKNDILSFMENVAGRSVPISTAVQGVLYPNEITVDLSQSGPAAYLGVESGGATGGKFGGRGLSDDVVSIDLGAIFGATIPTLISTIPDDNKENNCLITDNVVSGQGGTQTQTAFPYLVAPH